MSGFVSSYVMMERMQYRIDDFDMSVFYTLCPSLFVYEIRVSMHVISFSLLSSLFIIPFLIHCAMYPCIPFVICI